MNHLKLHFLPTLLGAALLLIAGNSWAVSGTVTGRAWLFINQGQSCSTASPYNMDCSAARFPVSINNSHQPIRQARVELADQDGAIIGVSSTDQNGDFSIAWTRSTTPSSATVRWVFSHVDNRFRVAPPANPASVWYSSTWSFSVTAGGTTSIGDAFWGDTEERQAYDNSFRMWDEALSYSGVANSVWSGVVIL